MKTSVRLLALAVVVLMMLTLTLSCKKQESEAVISYGSTVMNEKMYIYELSRYKSELLDSYGSTGVDIPEIWTTSIGEGATFDDFCYAQCQMNICSMLFFAEYAKTHGIELSEEEKEFIDEKVDTLIATLGSKGAVNKYLENYGVDINLYREYLELYEYYTNGVEAAYADGGDMQITTEEAYEYYKENFITVKHVAIGTDIAGTDQEGNYIYFTDEEKKAQQDKIDSIRERIRNGESFDELYLESEDKQADLYPDGYTITEGVLSEEMTGYADIALSLEIGEVGEWEKEDFGHYFIKRVELLDSDFEHCQNHILPILVEQDMAKSIVDNFDNFTMNQDIIDSYNIASAAVMK
ncbi:MAG: hypothetical protein IKV53_05465 [Clostridia bacterium]|nr:hypothetical protein [Clostridia bacterium]